MRLLAVLGGLAVVAVILLSLVMLSGGEKETTPPEGEAASAPPPEVVLEPALPARPDPGPDSALKRVGSMPDEEREQEMAELSQDTLTRFGQEFEKKWYEDRQRLGKERHQLMEQLWMQGRRPFGNPESMTKLEKLLEDYPGTNRAGCAAFELGQHYARSRALDPEGRRKKAEHFWRMAEVRYPDSLCEYNARPAAMSKLALATWVYRSTNPALARRLLEEIIQRHRGETDHLGQPLEVTAKRLLEQLR